jgi:hypothetical protein
MKKKCCWFSHNHSEPKGYALAHIGGKMTKAPKNRDVMLLLKCSDCDHIQEVFYKEVDSDLAKEEVKSLNATLNLTSQDVPEASWNQGPVGCGF